MQFGSNPTGAIASRPTVVSMNRMGSSPAARTAALSETICLELSHQFFVLLPKTRKQQRLRVWRLIVALDSIDKPMQRVSAHGKPLNGS